jgi:predicted nucleic acid-binding protein
VSRTVLDAGALIALERNDRTLWAALKLAATKNADVLVPSTVLAEVWRGTKTQAQLAKALKHCVIASFDEVARAVGELCGRTRTADISDAHVAIVAARQGDVLYTSDPGDLRRLVAACGRRRLVVVTC